ncbi:MAG: CCA tRNA nucleotidyltransferase [Marinibacterium sp.]
MTRIAGDWLDRPATQSVLALLEKAGHQALLVGGCVRNALIGAPVSDIDIATDARPEQVMALARDGGLTALPTGIDHGTVTVMADHIPHEVTTFRRDVSTDGRRAVVDFADRIEEDAARRDFTMNALYARADGSVLDPLGGLADLRARRVRFIGDAGARIREDYLRSLRYFRFHAWYGEPERGMDDAALAAIAGHLDGLDLLSRERVGAEMMKLLAAPNPAPAVAAMRSTGALARLLPGADDTWLAPLVHVEGEVGLAPDPVRRLAVLGDAGMAATLRLSRAQMRGVEMLRDAATGGQGAGEIGYRLGAERATDALVLRWALSGQPVDLRAIEAGRIGALARLPVSARDLMPDLQGPALGERLNQLEAAWIASGFALDRAALLALPAQDGKSPEPGG